MMIYGEIKIIGEQIFFDNIAIADLRDDVLNGLKEDFKKNILNYSVSNGESGISIEDAFYQKTYQEGYQEGYSDAIINMKQKG